MNPAPSVNITVVVHAPDPVTNAVFVTAVVTHTGPMVPVIVNVQIWPRPMFAALLDQAKSVPLAIDVTAGVGNPLGSDAVALVTTGEIVSVTVSAVIVIVPVFVTTTWYVTALPMPGTNGV
jgi:hypothetical protein